MAQRSAGILLYRIGASGGIEALLVHPGGPFWARKDDGAWSIPKGEYADDQSPFDAAVREFAEELGQPPPGGPAIPLDEVRQKGGKRVVAWAVRGSIDVDSIESNSFEMEWPPKSGQFQSFPEIDRAEWFGLDTARIKILSGQAPLIDQLEALLADPESGHASPPA